MWWRELLWVEIWSSSDLWESTTPTHPLWKILWPQNFLSQSECLILLQEISLKWLDHLNSFFIWQFKIMIETCTIIFDYWWLLQLFTSVCPLKPILYLYKFSNMFRHLVLINLLFTLYIMYFIYIIYIVYYIIQFLSRGFLTKI